MENNPVSVSCTTGKCRCKKMLSVCGFSVASAIASGLAVLALGLMAMYWGLGAAWVTLLGSVYKGYVVTPMGIWIGAGWAALEGLICGFIFVIIYNLIARCCPCCSCKS